MSFAVGQIVRPKLQYARKDGSLQDWAGKRSAQGLVTVGASAGVAVPSIPYWDPQSSTNVSATKTENQYTVTVWDLDAQAFVSGVYMESELDAGTVNSGTPVTATFAATALTPGSIVDACANLARSRS